MTTRFDGAALHLAIGGESHGPYIWGTAEGLPPGERVDLAAVRAFAAKRAPGGRGATTRREDDRGEVVSGMAPARETKGTEPGEPFLKGDADPGKGCPAPKHPAGMKTAPAAPFCTDGAVLPDILSAMASDGSAAPAGPEPHVLPDGAAQGAPLPGAAERAGFILTGERLEVRIKNKDARPKDYEALKNLPRPSHADYAAAAKYGPGYSPSGGGPFSGRMTAPLCFLGGVAMELLRARGVTVAAHLAAVDGIEDEALCSTGPDARQLAALIQNPLPFISPKAEAEVLAALEQARQDGDSLAGTVEAAVYGLPAGCCGGPVFEGLEGRIAPLVFAVPGVKGLGFGACPQGLRGSTYNDPFLPANTGGAGGPCPTNRHGGILGGIPSGMPVVMRAFFKPTPSIALPQQTVDLSTGLAATLRIEGRHDPCIALRGAYAVAAALALGVLDALLFEERKNANT